MSYFSVVSRKVLHSLAIEGDESCLLSTPQDIAGRCDHPATNIGRKGPI
jgi:hypothetical protein